MRRYTAREVVTVRCLVAEPTAQKPQLLALLGCVAALWNLFMALSPERGRAGPRCRAMALRGADRTLSGRRGAIGLSLVVLALEVNEASVVCEAPFPSGANGRRSTVRAPGDLKSLTSSPGGGPLRCARRNGRRERRHRMKVICRSRQRVPGLGKTRVWQRRMGVEPTRERSGDRAAVLKTVRPTGTRTPPCRAR